MVMSERNSQKNDSANSGSDGPETAQSSSEYNSSTLKVPDNFNRINDLFTAKPPDFKLRVQTMLYNKGLHSRPKYLNDIYQTIPRTVYVNQELPDAMKDVHGHPRLTYPRNKIRTTKYTPITFLPKNIIFQFTNVANTYFLVMIILSAFQIFGVQSPGLQAVPLVVIVVITAIRDAYEDYSRGSSDNELNNSPIHLLVGLDNPNVETDYVDPWRRFKKASTRVTRRIGKAIARGLIMTFGKKKKKQEVIRKENAEKELELRRVSTVISDTSDFGERPRMSTTDRSHRPFRKSHQSQRHISQPVPHTITNPKLQQEHSEKGAKNPKFKNRSWKDVSVGDFIRVRSDEEVPADIVILGTSDAEGNCYIETKNLDGETNLKTKNSLACGGSLSHANSLGFSKFWIECDAPNPHLYSFKGTLHYENFDESGHMVNPDEKEAVTNNNVLLRGTTLRNTAWVIGVVIYTGSETKIMLNSGITPTKASRISRELNLSVVINFVILFILCFVSGLINGLFYDKEHVSRIYFDFKPYGSTPAVNGILAFFVTLIIYQSLVPISLYISVEIIKTLQAFFIFADVKMYYAKLDFPCTPKSWNISDDLGQIEYVFSDKTGTLTQNVMEFKKMTINGTSYGLAYTEAQQGIDKREGKDIVAENEKWRQIIQKDRSEMIENLVNNSKNNQFREEALTFVSNDYVKDTMMTEGNSEQKAANETFMLALSLCHTVVTVEDESDPDYKIFKAESPDEAALVSVSRDLGFAFRDRFRKKLIVDIYGEGHEFELLEVIQFTSARKRMSCIIKTPEGKIIMVTKGADNVIFQRLVKDTDPQVLQKTALHLEDFAKEGLRTLVIAQKELDPSYYSNWVARYKEALSSIDDSREEFISELEDEIEQGLYLLGGTAIEDRLQDGVPDSIALLGQAGIKLWVLTGDRIETAINIGFSCNLLGNQMQLLVVRPDPEKEYNVKHLDNLLTQYLQDSFGMLRDSSKSVDDLIKEDIKDHSVPEDSAACVIDGAALTIIFSDLSEQSEELRDLQKKFLLLGKRCKSVICCRVSPSQKAEVVKMVKQQLSVMTLAIGDGANDVAMIQAANIGVGIAGEEGRQAVMSSDYGLGQFRFLTRLLLVHGRWSYKRLAEMVPCFFYKNVVFTLTCFWYGIFNNFDGSYLYEFTFLMFFNLAFTSLPVIVLAVLDQDVSDTISLLVPQLYRTGIYRLEWSQFKFAWYMIDGLYQSAVSFFFPYLLFYKSFQNMQGLAVDHRFWIGVLVACVSVTACNFYVLLQQYRWDWLTLLIDAISILLVYFWSGVWSSRVYAGEFYKAGAQVLGTLACWCVVFVGVVVCLLPRFTHDFLKRNFKPRDIDIIRERARHGAYEEYFEGYDPTSYEDVERLRVLKAVMERPEMLDKIDLEQPDSAGFAESHEHDSPLAKTFHSIKRRATVSRSRKNTVSRSRRDTVNAYLKQPMNLEQLRQEMIRTGEYRSSRNSLERITTTHELPGLTRAETLLSYHTRNSINLDRNAV